MLNKTYRPFAEARVFARSLKLKSRTEWKNKCKSGLKATDIPTNPNMIYRQDWRGWGDWLGTFRIADQYKKYRDFTQARSYVHSLGLKSGKEWKEFIRKGQKPDDIPSNPRRTYRKEWKSMGDWLGTGRVASQYMKYTPFEEAREFVHKLRLKNRGEWNAYSKSDKKPGNIPARPDNTYETQWKGIKDWLGPSFTLRKNCVPFNEAKDFVHNLGLNDQKEWWQYCNSGKKPEYIPADPSYYYKKDWTSWGDWLGTGRVAIRNKVYRPFNEARDYVRNLGLKSYSEWMDYCESGKKPNDIPRSASMVYEEEWVDWADWLGYETSFWSVRKVKQLLKDLITSRIIYEWDEAVLYSFLLRKGVLSLGDDRMRNRHTQFFKHLVEAARTEEGRKAIEEYTNSDSEVPPSLSGSTANRDADLGEIQKASSEELAKLVEDSEPLDYGKIKSAEQILANSHVLESINVDEEAMQFYLNYSIDELWKAAFRNEENTIAAVRREGKNGNKYHDTIVDMFLSDYEHIQKISLPKGYAFPYPPTLMQLYVSYKIKTSPYFGNFSGTGAGKTLSAVLASRIIDSKITVIVCPNDVVDQWNKSIEEIYPNSNVVTGKKAFFIRYDKDKYQYLILNYDKFSQKDSSNLILNLVKGRIDFVVLDEVHFVKRRDEESSLRRKHLGGLMPEVRKENNKVKVLGLSATPVINNLMEGRSLLEIITSKIYEDVAIRPTIPNAVTLFEKLSTVSIREMPQYNIDLQTKHIDVEAVRPRNISIKHLKSNPLAIEQFLTDARIPEIIRLIEEQTIIYTEYVTEVIEKLSKAVQEAGYSYALYTGSDRSGLKRFLDKRIRVLIASRPISVGVDGLQHICNRLIINTLPWTNAQYQQLLGRLVRKGQIRDVVHVYIVKANVKGYPYDQLKWNRIQFKRTLADCAVDGRLPERNLITPQQAAMESVRWLERLERGEISSVTRRDLNIELTPVEIEQRIRKYGDFTRLNNQFNNENSETTNKRIFKDPKEWEEYHRQYREARKGWSIIPYEEIVKRIKLLSRRLQIGDFGCGEAKIMEVFGSERVYSFDHVAINDKVTACDMKYTGLPDDAIDVAIFSLSLMGRNWQEYISEAKRCLATNGYLLISETTKSFKRRLSRLRDVIKEQGFDIYTDEERGDFTFIEARAL